MGNDAMLMNVLGQFMKGKADRVRQEREDARQKSQDSLAAQMAKLQMQAMKIKEAQLAEAAKYKDVVFQGLFPQPEPQAEPQAGASDSRWGPSFDAGQPQQPSGGDFLDKMTEAQLAFLSKEAGYDLLGAKRAQLQGQANERLDKYRDLRLKEQVRGNDIRENAITYHTITNPDGSQSIVPLRTHAGVTGSGARPPAMPGSRPMSPQPSPTLGINPGIQTNPPQKSLPVSEANMPLWRHEETFRSPDEALSPNELMKRGYRRLNTGQVDRVDSLNSALTTVDALGDKVGDVFAGVEDTIPKRALGAASRKFKSVSQMGVDEAAYDSFIAGTLAPMIRGLGEKGALSDSDVKRAINLMPVLTDRPAVARRKVDQIRELIQENMKKIISAKVHQADVVWNPETLEFEPVE